MSAKADVRQICLCVSSKYSTGDLPSHLANINIGSNLTMRSSRLALSSHVT